MVSTVCGTSESFEILESATFTTRELMSQSM
jgi:hypothetical protein